VSRLAGRAGLIRAVVFFAALIVIPLVGAPGFLLNTLIFTVMYAWLASAWNLVGGYAGYPSLGHVAFFGIGAYSVGLIFSKSVYGGYLPFFILPVIGVAVALLAIPIGWVSMRTRADVFAIVTITVLFITQTLAFNLKGLTGGAQGTSVARRPSVSTSTTGRSTSPWSYFWDCRWGSRSISAGRRSACRSRRSGPTKIRPTASECA
jgi:branched-chain amino acid transport system permease protein